MSKRFVLWFVLVVLIGAIGAAIWYTQSEAHILRHELSLGFVGIYDADARRQITEGKFWIDDQFAPYGRNIPLRSDPRMNFRHNPMSAIHDIIQVAKDDDIEQLIERFVPGAKLIEPPIHSKVSSQGKRPRPVRFDLWQCLLERSNGSLDSCWIIAVQDAYDNERAAFVFRGERAGVSYLPEVVSLEARVTMTGRSLMSEHTDGHNLMFQIGKMRDPKQLPEIYHGREWFTPKK